MPASRPDLPLYVDLDGTLIKSDMTCEALLLLIKRNVFYLALIPFWLLQGLRGLKQQIARRVHVPVEKIPFNSEFLQYLQHEKAAGRKLVLISASHQQHVDPFSTQVPLFDAVVGSDQSVNLKSHNKLERIREMNGAAAFAYAGNATADIPIWSAAEQAILVNCSPALQQAMPVDTDNVLRFDAAQSPLGKLWQAMRPHQWLKNSLLFVPLILSHQLLEPELLLQAIVAFISFSLCASSVYLLNDLFDLQSDRLHLSKCQRPFASGELDLRIGLLSMPTLLTIALLIALFLPPQFLLVLVSYFVLTTLYSLVLKRWFLIDVAVLALLYGVRIIAGAAAIAVPATGWLIGFALSLFLGLAMIKRIAELSNLQGDAETSPAGRAYQIGHRRLLIGLGASSSLLAVLIFALYINDPATTRLYQSPQTLWLICPLLLILLIRIWRRARAGVIDEDPVYFAATDRISQIVVLLCGLLVWAAI